jgi:hypothetical protein
MSQVFILQHATLHIQIISLPLRKLNPIHKRILEALNCRMSPYPRLNLLEISTLLMYREVDFQIIRRSSRWCLQNEIRRHIRLAHHVLAQQLDAMIYSLLVFRPGR